MPLPAFLAAIGAMAAKAGPAIAKAGAAAGKVGKAASAGMKTATPFMNALSGMMGGGQPQQPQFGGQIMGASAPMSVAGLSSAAPVSPQISQQMDPMLMMMLQRQRQQGMM
jgi:hypothetical protein